MIEKTIADDVLEAEKKDDGGQAFPGLEYEGMTLRDWFAGRAFVDVSGSGLPGVEFAEAVVGRKLIRYGPEKITQDQALESLKFWEDYEAICKYRKADTMIARREK